jgi:copper oxidase (laccase) domain-containing protein
MDDCFVALSHVSDGNMLIPDDRSNADIANHRSDFLQKHSITMEQSSRVNVTYDTPTFKRYLEVSLSQHSSAGMYNDAIAPADALVTRDIHHALFLPLADCVGAVLYDPVHKVLMLSHLGRHSVEQHGGTSSVEFLVKKFGSAPSDIRVWLTPSPGKENYPMWAFNNRSIKEVVIEQLISAGIVPTNITDDSTDTTTDLTYFSHSEFLAGRRDVDGRYAIVAMMKQ